MAVAYLPELEQFRERFAELSSYAVTVRYSEAGDDPPRHKVLQYLAAAQEAVAMVRQHVTEASPDGQ